VRTYEAGITGDYADGAHPTDASLLLKQGAKVILLRNDPDRRWVNGTIARIARLEDKRVWIELDGKTHEIEPVSWEARRYSYDQVSEKIVENVTGTFRQFPLRLAWALTIHMSPYRAAAHSAAWRWPARCARRTSCSTARRWATATSSRRCV
jgi:hypothetical protein